ncbi:MAG: hypothetical protein ACI4I5_05955 [Acutalibacteraceae bacterium]
MVFKTINDESKSFASNLKQTFNSGFGFKFEFDDKFISQLTTDLSLLNKAGGLTEKELSKLSLSAQELFTRGNLSAESIEKFALGQKQAQIAAAASSNALGKSIGLMKEYNSALKNSDGITESCGIGQKDFVDAVNQGNSSLGGYLKSLNGAEASLLGYGAYLTKTKAATIALNATTKVLNFTVNAFKTALSSIAITAAVSLLMKVFEALKNYMRPVEEKIADINSEIEDLTNNARDAIEEFRSLKSSSDEIVPRFTELAQKAGFNGSQGSLSNEEYKEFIDLSNRLAKLFPELASGVDENGNSIIRFTGEVDSFTQSVEDLVEQARILTAEKVRENSEDAWERANKSQKIYQNEGNKYQSYQGILEWYKSRWEDYKEEPAISQIESIYKKIYGEDSWESFNKTYWKNGKYDWDSFFNSDEFDYIIERIQKEITLLDDKSKSQTVEKVQ